MSYLRPVLMVMLVMLIAYAGFAQEATPDVTPPAEQTSEPTIEATETVVSTTETPLETTPEATVTPEVTAEITEEPTPEIAESTAEATVEITPEVTAEATLELTPEVTVEVTETPIAPPEVELTPEATIELEVTAEATLELTPEVTSEITPEVTAEATLELTPEVTSEITPEVTETPVVYVLQYVSGLAQYQAREINAGIRVYVFDEFDALLSVAETNEAGIYSVAIPQDVPYWLHFDAALHQRASQNIQPDGTIEDILLLGGDINDDTCIGMQDLHLLLEYFEEPDSAETDISGDGFTDLSDLAILTGNLDTTCEESLIEETPTVEVTEVVIGEATPEVTAVATELPIDESTPEVTAIATEAPTDEDEPTDIETTPEATKAIANE